MGSMLGGGGGGGSVVQQTDPKAALAAGQVGSAAANEASNLSTKALTDAMAAINSQYSQANYALQPYRTTGVQALDQLNQYLGLGAYNPGAAPLAPKDPSTYQPSQSDIDAYVKANSHVGNEGQDGKQYTIYTGAGARPTDWAHETQGGARSLQDIIGFNGQGGIRADQLDTVKGLLTQKYKDDNAENFAAQNQQYAQDLQEYNQNKDWYDQYSAAGPLTPEQISDKISNMPGYQAQMLQGTDAIAKQASAKGYLGSGRILKELGSYGQNTLSQFYGDELSRLAGLVTQGSQASTTTSANRANQGNSLSQLYNNIGDNQANAALAAGQSNSNALTAANQQFKVIGQQNGNLSGVGSILGTVAKGVAAYYTGGASLAATGV